MVVVVVETSTFVLPHFHAKHHSYSFDIQLSYFFYHVLIHCFFYGFANASQTTSPRDYKSTSGCRPTSCLVVLLTSCLGVAPPAIARPLSCSLEEIRKSLVPAHNSWLTAHNSLLKTPWVTPQNHGTFYSKVGSLQPVNMVVLSPKEAVVLVCWTSHWVLWRILLLPVWAANCNIHTAD